MAKFADITKITGLLIALNSFIFCTLAFAAKWDGVTMARPSTAIIEGFPYYKLGTPEELAWFANRVNSKDTSINAILTADIDLNMQPWIPIGYTDALGYDGIFDGNGHSISGLYITDQTYAGLFGILDSGTVKNLTIDNSTISVTEKGFAGSIAAHTKWYSKVENVINKAKIESDYTINEINYVGGIAGLCEGFIRDAQNEANITISQASGYVGGICGIITGNNVNPDSNLFNAGNIYGGLITGGIVGEGNFMKRTYNHGNVSGYYGTGGICGHCSSIMYSDNFGYVKNINSSKLKKEEIFIGGICGCGCSTINTCRNYGNIKAQSNSSIYAGGITGVISFEIKFAANHGNLNISSTNGTAFVGGITGDTYSSAREIESVYNQGSLYSSHYAAGITPSIKTNISLKNFYVATKNIDAPNAAGFVYYNEKSTLSNGYFDATLLPNITLTGENHGTLDKIQAKSTKDLQQDSMAYILEDVQNYSFGKQSFYTLPNTHWSRGNGYPIFEDSLHNPIYKILFINNADSTFLYTDSSSHINPFPTANDATLYSWNSISYMTDMYTVDNNTVFTWADSLIVAVHSACNSDPESDVGCCMKHFLDLYDEWENECQRIGGTFFASKQLCQDNNNNGLLDGFDNSSIYFTILETYSEALQTCKISAQSSNSTEESSSSSNEQSSSSSEPTSSNSEYSSAYIDDLSSSSTEILPESSSSEESSSSIPFSSANENSSSSLEYSSAEEYSSSSELASSSSEYSSAYIDDLSSSSTEILPESSSTKNIDEESSSSEDDFGGRTITHNNNNPLWSIHINGRHLQISGLGTRSSYILFDMQGHILQKGYISFSNTTIFIPSSGSYIISINNQTKVIHIK